MGIPDVLFPKTKDEPDGLSPTSLVATLRSDSSSKMSTESIFFSVFFGYGECWINPCSWASGSSFLIFCLVRNSECTKSMSYNPCQLPLDIYPLQDMPSPIIPAFILACWWLHFWLLFLIFISLFFLHVLFSLLKLFMIYENNQLIIHLGIIYFMLCKVRWFKIQGTT